MPNEQGLTMTLFREKILISTSCQTRTKNLERTLIHTLGFYETEQTEFVGHEA